jgi:putative sigma-54 modulation protein
MIITITGRQTEVPSDFAKTAEKKLKKFDKFFREDASATLKIGRKRGRETVELTILSGGTLFRSEKQEDTMLNAFDSAIEAIEGQIRKNKTRLSKRLKEGTFAKTEKGGDLTETEEQDNFKIRTKSFKFKPMSTEEAILQMNLLGHNFFVFENDESGKVNVVYLRNDGDYGHIIPD